MIPDVARILKSPNITSASSNDSVKQEPSVKKVLFISPECTPFAKVGGLADVVAALPKALRRMGYDARIVLPLYKSIDLATHRIEHDGSSCVHMGHNIEHWIGIYHALLDGEVPTYFIDFDSYFGRGGGIYGDHNGEFLDNAYRFALLSKAAMQLCKDRLFIPDVMHLHDWPAALTAVFLKTWDRIFSPLSSCASVLTIHNVGHQGKFPADAYGYFGLGGEHFNTDAFEDYGWINILKAGIRFADAITTVSPTHLHEIRSPAGGRGLAPYLNNRSEDLTGILNGVDTDRWNPETDPILPARYNAEDLSGKAICKKHLQERMGLEVRPDVPLFGIISRLAPQKGIALLRSTLPHALERINMQLVMLGTGEPVYEHFFRWLENRYRGRVTCHIGYSEELAHLIEGGSDFFLMPSLYEPCGLNQIYSMRYGTLPVVRGTGGLEDTVSNYDPQNGKGTGFKFYDVSVSALLNTIIWATATWFNTPQHIEALRRQAMAQDFSWTVSAEHYLEVYRQAIFRRKSWT